MAVSNKRWSKKSRGYVRDEAVNEFLDAVIALSKEHGLSIGHEDSQGAFIVMPYDEQLSDWLWEAHVDR